MAKKTSPKYRPDADRDRKPPRWPWIVLVVLVAISLIVTTLPQAGLTPAY